jgi:hypothetical protein
MSKEDMDKYLNETREDLKILMLRMQQGEKYSSRYEWPMKEKVKCPIRKLISRRHKKMLRRWLRRRLRQVETLSDIEEKIFYVSEPEDGEILGDEEERSVEDLIDCWEGNKKRSIEYLINC